MQDAFWLDDHFSVQKAFSLVGLRPPLSEAELERIRKMAEEKKIPQLYALGIMLGVYRGAQDLPKQFTDAHLRAFMAAAKEQRTRKARIADQTMNPRTLVIPEQIRRPPPTRWV